MVTNAIKNKSQRLFDMMDENRNGVISAKDLQLTAERLIDAFGVAESAKARQVINSYTKVWEELAAQADTDGDGQISRAEFESAFAGADQGKGLQAINRAIDAEFELADSDGDGMLSRDELSRMLRAFRVPQSELDTAVAALDQDGDGQVSAEEYRAAMREFYLSDDLTTPGSQLLGRIRAAV
ncbi:EF-hand domain-containing protein [Streptomyces sp. AK02-01A]|uniref:EF-hand domain-containing protein n=1 Tax=Streptomyces sp. AK02-01A TaxID=3028648 RepID=UPI0029AE04AE|nr:EF-hand domain-containing protein [Streptomyces sp. AK02-01A]MDX3852396.1 EF-hand domain-containing protein [Streptomyces sp. AK02-01A]